MDSLNFLRQLQGSRCQGDGVRVDYDIDISAAYLLSDGSALTTTLTTNPGFAAAETSARVIQWAATKVVGATFRFAVPRDYDRTKDELRFRAEVQMGGATDTPGLTLHVFKKSVGVALGADLGPITGKTPSAALSPLGNGQATTVALSNVSQTVEFDVSGNSIVGGDVLYLQLVPAAHGTDAVNLYDASIQYRSDVVFWTEAQR